MRKFNDKKNFELFEINGDWEVYLSRPVYKEIRAYGNFKIVNTETGVDCGQLVQLYKTIFDKDGERLAEPIYDKDCYEIVEVEE
jgi:hypothetical protein